MSDLNHLVSVIITDDENLNITKELVESELHSASLSIPKDSSLCPDGFGSDFYVVCWDFIIDDDLKEVVLEFLNGASLPIFFSSPLIVLISKILDLISFDKFGPIISVLWSTKFS